MQSLINLQGALNHMQTTTFSSFHSACCVWLFQIPLSLFLKFSIFLFPWKKKSDYPNDEIIFFLMPQRYLTVISSLVCNLSTRHFLTLFVDFSDFIWNCRDTSRGKPWGTPFENKQTPWNTPSITDWWRIWTGDVFVLENQKVTQRKVCQNEPTRYCFMQQKPGTSWWKRATDMSNDILTSDSLSLAPPWCFNWGKPAAPRRAMLPFNQLGYSLSVNPAAKSHDSRLQWQEIQTCKAALIM